ncbi:type IV fimbrial biogenesis protein FimT [Thalassolituus maritimus]|uniref:Type II secretion system protein H n=1 Tax=Thalassolituus maritimus TaxID=484498 RepID=A0A1N7IWN1_9GAMM|nr:GspH/FimT family pseudopilin [Thalassolituus maritimus]SIS41512.1 type IV fimbrial biogenesis protein FimT [Thalassolituus maritimus]
MNTGTILVQNTIKGFTLLELLVVVAISGILLGVGLPAMGALIERNQFEAEVSALHRAVALSRSMAVYRGEAVSLCPLDNLGNCSDQWSNSLSIFADTDRSGSLDENEVIIKVLPALSGDSSNLIRDFNRSSAVMFYPSGSAFGRNGTMKVCLRSTPNLSATIIISGSGRIRMGKDQDDDGLVESSSGDPVDCT